MKFNNNVRKTVCLILLFVIGLSMLFFFALSPYEEWDPTGQQVDYDVVDSLKCIWTGLLFLNIMCVFFAKPFRRCSIVFVIYSFASFIKLISLFIIT